MVLHEDSSFMVARSHFRSTRLAAPPQSLGGRRTHSQAAIRQIILDILARRISAHSFGVKLGFFHLFSARHASRRLIGNASNSNSGWSTVSSLFGKGLPHEIGSGLFFRRPHSAAVPPSASRHIVIPRTLVLSERSIHQKTCNILYSPSLTPVAPEVPYIRVALDRHTISARKTGARSELATHTYRVAFQNRLNRFVHLQSLSVELTLHGLGEVASIPARDCGRKVWTLQWRMMVWVAEAGKKCQSFEAHQ